MTREGRQDRREVAELYTAAKGYKALFAALYCAAVRINGITDREGYLTDDYIVNVLYTDGSVAYHIPTRTWWKWTPVGEKNAYGVTERVRLYSQYRGAGLEARRDDVYIFDANSEAFGIARFVNDKCHTLADFDAAIDQNLDAIKDMTVIVADNNEIAQKLREVDKKRRRGYAVATLSRRNKNGGLSALETLSTGAEYKLDRLQDDRRKLYEELLHLVGVDTAFEKGERMITDEAQMQGAETSAYIRIMIDTFNRQAQEQGAPFRMERVRKALAENDDKNAPKTDENENDEGVDENVEKV